MKKNYFSLAILLFSILPIQYSFASGRVKHSINESWQFLRSDVDDGASISFNDSDWQLVDIPHTWNNKDVTDDVPDYYRNAAWYRRTIFIPADKDNQQVTIFFEGANQEVDLYINGNHAGRHEGGYTRFSFDITSLLNYGERNVFAIKVNNKHNEDIPPLSADFTFFGGIYRDIYLIYTNKQHISTTHYASSGVYITTPKVNEYRAEVVVKTMLANAMDVSKTVVVEHQVVDNKNALIKTVSKKIKLAKFSSDAENIQQFQLDTPQLWSPESPALYKVYTRIYDEKGKELLDEVINPLGLRWFEFTAEKGFVLNGKPIKLIGTSRHQCYEGMGNALPDEMHVRDVILLKEMGGNFLRVSHYPQDPVVMEMCDKLGIITSVEIPIVNAITENEAFTRNCLNMAREMVYQDFNRPSVLIWAYMNEVLLRLPSFDTEERTTEYLGSVKMLAQQIEDLIRTEDPYRYTLLPFHGSFKTYHKAGLTRIPMIVGWNLYQGWYGNSFDKFDAFLDDAQKELEGVPFIITEYGADVDPRLHSFEPTRFDYTAEYANLYHEHYVRAIMERPYVVGANIWNLNDFHSEQRANAVPHINNKGITSTTRELKDTYLLYKAIFTTEPVVMIGGSNWKIRGGNADVSNVCLQPVKVYTNQESVELIHNSRSLGHKLAFNNIAEFDVPFVTGNNTLEASVSANSNTLRDMLKIDFRMIPANLKDEALPFREINVMLGSKRYFEDKENSVIWFPEKEYSPGSWGYIGGENYVKKTRHGQQPASDLDIWGTTKDPIYQTMRTGIESFIMDVPDGEYTISFHWAELQGGEAKVLAYNLGNDALKDDFIQRIFNASINGKEVISKLNLMEKYGRQRAVEKKYIVNVSGGQGIKIGFDALEGETMLNAIRVYRNY